MSPYYAVFTTNAKDLDIAERFQQIFYDGIIITLSNYLPYKNLYSRVSLIKILWK